MTSPIVAWLNRTPILILLPLMWLVIAEVLIWTMPPDARLDRDEGFNLIKAQLVLEGHPLYQETWSDQPPLFTSMLVGLDRLVGLTPTTARALVAVHAGLLLLSSGYLAFRFGGKPLAGILAILLILSGRQFGKLSVAVMIGLPAIALATSAVALVMMAAGRRRQWIVLPLAGLAMATAALVKLFALVLLPFAIATGLWAAADRRSESDDADNRSWVRTVAALALMLAFCLGGLWLLGPWNEPGWKQQLVDVHTHRLPRDPWPIKSVGARLLEDLPILAAAISLGLLAGREGWRRTWPAWTWFACSVVALSQANPVWGHHRVLLVTPLAIIAGTAFVVATRRSAEHFTVPPIDVSTRFAAFRQTVGRWVAGGRPRPMAFVAVGALACAAAVGAAQRGYDLVRLGRADEDRLDGACLRTLRQTTHPGDVLLTDDPHMAIAAGLTVPPDVAVWSYKRQMQGYVGKDLLVAARDHWNVRAILVGRYRLDEGLESELTAGFHAVINKPYRRLYLKDEPSAEGAAADAE